MGKKIIERQVGKADRLKESKLVYDHPPTNSGMLGGAIETHSPDVKTSNLLFELF